jgi:hypothetical protein
MKNQCSFKQEVERWFDGEQEDSESLRFHMESCECCQVHIAFLRECRDTVSSMPAAPGIADAQMSAFLEGIANAVHTPRKRSAGFWAMASALTAALVVAVSTITIVSSGPDPVGAESMIETVSTEIDGATVEILDENSATPTVWLHLPEGGEI